MTTFTLNRLAWQLLPAFVALIGAIALVTRIVPQKPQAAAVPAPPGWDLPARIDIATAFVIVLTSAANGWGHNSAG